MPWCMHRDVGFCCCSQLPYIVFGRDATYYPASGLLRVETQLFHMTSTRPGRHAVHLLVKAAGSSSFSLHAPGVYNRVFMRFRYSVTQSRGGMFVEIPYRLTFGVEYLHERASLLVHLRRLQRLAKRYVHRKWQARALAVMMASHARLGAGSVLEGLHADVLALILSK